MMTKGFLKNAMNAASQWLKTEFPSQETEEKLADLGWTKKFNTITSIGAYYPSVVTITTRVTPEGKDAVPGSKEYDRFKDTVKDIVRQQQVQPK